MFGDQGIFVDRSLFFDAGMFPEIPVMEDYQFSLTLKERGVKLGMTGRRIYTSDRRFPKGTLPKLKLMWKMNRLRKMYRDRVPIGLIDRMYRDGTDSRVKGICGLEAVPQRAGTAGPGDGGIPYAGPGRVQQELPVYPSCHRQKAGAPRKLRQPDAFGTSDTVRI